MASSTDLTTYGKIENGELIIHKSKEFKAAIAASKDRYVQLTLTTWRKKHSTEQQGYYFGLVVPAIADAINDAHGEFYSYDAIHEFLKIRFNSRRILNETSGEYIDLPCSTAELNTTEYGEYIEKCRRFAAEFLNLDIPDPDKDFVSVRKKKKSDLQFFLRDYQPI